MLNGAFIVETRYRAFKDTEPAVTGSPVEDLLIIYLEGVLMKTIFRVIVALTVMLGSAVVGQPAQAQAAQPAGVGGCQKHSNGAWSIQPCISQSGVTLLGDMYVDRVEPPAGYCAITLSLVSGYGEKELILEDEDYPCVTGHYGTFEVKYLDKEGLPPYHVDFSVHTDVGNIFAGGSPNLG